MLSEELLNPNASGPRQMILQWPVGTVIVFQLILSLSHRIRNEADYWMRMLHIIVGASLSSSWLASLHKGDSFKIWNGTSNWWRVDHCLLFQLQESLGKWVSDMFEFHQRRWLLPNGIKDFINMTNVFRYWVVNNWLIRGWWY